MLQVWTPLKSAVQPYAMLCRADGLKLYDDNGVHLKLGILIPFENEWRAVSGIRGASMFGLEFFLAGFDWYNNSSVL